MSSSVSPDFGAFWSLIINLHLQISDCREIVFRLSVTSLRVLPHVIHILQLGPEDRRWRPLPGFSHVFSGAPLCQQRHDHLPLPVRWVQLSAGEPFTSL